MPDAQPELSGAPLALGIYGKMPAHGDFVRRGLPSSFVTPWDAWLSAGVAAAREQLADGFASVWDDAPAWRFALPAGVCGPDAVVGVMLPSVDTVGRRFPLTAAALLPPGVVAEDVWFARLEAAVRAARHGSIDADGMIRAMQSSAEPEPEPQAPSGDVLGMLGAGMVGAAFADAASAEPLHASGDAAPWRMADPMDGPADDSAPDAADDMWGALLGDAPAEALAEDPMDGPAPGPAEKDWGALLGDVPLGAPAVGSPAPEAPLSGGGDIWGDLLGDPAPEHEAAMAPPSAAKPAGADEWGDLIGDPDQAPADGPDAQAGNTQLSVSTEVPDDAHEGDPTQADLVPRAATQSPPAAMPAAMPTERMTAPEPAIPEALPVVGAAPPPPPHAPVRPPEGGWWTLGGPHLSPMVWPLPELPPAESFILLLHNQDPESGA